MTYVEAITKSQSFSKKSSLVITILLVFFASLRDKVGTDWDAYYEYYKNSTDKVEIGYSILNNFFGKIGVPYNLFLFFLNSFSLTLIYYFLKNNSKFAIIGFLLFFSNLYLYYNFSGIRQAIAISITCFSFSFAKNRNFIYFSLLVLLASLFHLSAILFFAVYYIPRKSISLKNIFVFASLLLLSSIFLNSISDLITLYTLKDANFYVNYQEKSDSLMQLFLIGSIIRFIIILLVLVFREKLSNVKDFNYLINIYIFGLGIYLATYLISPDIGVRLSSYFTIFDLIIVGHLHLVSKSLTNRLLIVTLFSSIALYKILGYMNSEYYIYNILKF